MLPCRKRQYTKRLKDWDGKKYNIGGKNNTPLQSTLGGQDDRLVSVITTAAVPMEVDTTPEDTSGANSTPGVQYLADSATETSTDTAAIEYGFHTLAGSEMSIAKDTVTVVEHQKHSRTESLEREIESQDLILCATSNKGSESYFSNNTHSSIDAASSRNNDSMSITDNSFELPRSRPRTPVSAEELQSLAVSDEDVKDMQAAISEHVASLHDSLPVSEELEDASLNPHWRIPTMITVDELMDVTSSANDDPQSHTILTSSHELTKKISPMALLHLVESGNVLGILSDQDIPRIERLAEVFEAARSYEDAYLLRRLVLQQTVTRYERDKASAEPWQSPVVNLIKNASNVAAYKEATAFVKRAWYEEPALTSPRSVIGCLQRSYLGSMLGTTGEVHSAEHYCRSALDTMLALLGTNDMLYSDSSVIFVAGSTSSYFLASWLAVVANLISVWKEEWDSAKAWKRIEELSPTRIIMPYGYVRHSKLRGVLEWCISALADDDCWQMLLPVSSDLWLLAPSRRELEDVESRLLYFYLWTRVQASQDTHPQFNSTNVNLRSVYVARFAQAWGVSVAEVLSLVASIIITVESGRQESGSRDNLARRASANARAAYHFALTHYDFMEAYASNLRGTGNQFSTNNYAALVRTAIRDLTERWFHLELAVSALHDPRLRTCQSLVSMTPSYSPTMSSTPRSSWSGFQSFKSMGRRASKIWANSNHSNTDMWSLQSGRFPSMAGSMRSAVTLRSTTASNRDVIIEDDSES